MNARNLLAIAGVFGAVLLAGCPKPVEPIAPPNPPRIDRFEVSTTDAAARQTVTLSWSVSDATSVSIEQFGTGALPVTGNEGQLDVTLGDRDAVFVLIARGDGGTDSRVVRVNVNAENPLVVLAAVPPHVVAGESAVLVYSGPDGAQLFDEGGVALNATASGSLTVSPRFSATYTMKAGEAQATATVSVSPGILELDASPVQGVAGRVRVAWRAGGATGLVLAGGGRGELFSTDSKQAIAEGSFEDVLPGDLPQDAELSYALTVSDGATIATKQVTVRVGGTPAIDSFTAPTWAGTEPAGTAQFELKWVTRGAVRAEIWMGTTQLFEATNHTQVNSGSFYPYTPEAPTTYELRVFDADGRMAVAQASTQPVGPVVPVKFEASVGGVPCSPCAIAKGGEAVTLEWEVTNARRMRIVAKGRHLVHEAQGTAAETGRVVVYPNAASVEYVLTADNTAGNEIAPMSKIVTVTALSGVQTWPQKVPLPTGAPLAQAQVASTTVPNVVGYSGFPNVEKNAPGEAFVDIRSFGIDALFSPTADTSAEKVVAPEPITMVLFGKLLTNRSIIHVSINGWFTIDAGIYDSSQGLDTNKYGFPTKGLEDPTIAPFFDDLVMTPEGRVQVASIGSGDTRRLVVQYSDVSLESAPGSRLTFQAQVYASGKVVFAYQKLVGLLDPTPAIGIQDYTKTVAVMAPDLPRAGDTYTFFGPTATPPPFPVVYSGYLARMVLADGGFMEFDAKPVKLDSGLLYVSELNPTAGANVTGGEWIELTSTASEAINLRGFSIDFGNGQRHDITTDLVVPAGGRVLLAQSADAGDGLPVDHAYGAGFDIPDDLGRVSLVSGTYPYSSLEWSAEQAPGAGVSLRFDAKRGAPWAYASSSTGLICTGRSTYGTHGQLGTPGAADPGCFPYVLQASGGAPFESIAATGMKLNVTLPRGEVFEVELPFAVRMGNRLSSRVYVSSNGFLTLEPMTCIPTSSGCFSSNPSSPSTSSEPFGSVAVFWDAMDYAKAPLGGIFWEARDPDGLANTGDEYALISWEHVALYSSSSTFTSDLSFQAKLTARGDLEFRYGGMTASTASYAKGQYATSWLEDPTGNAALKINVNSSTSPGITANTTKLLTWEP